MRSPLAPRLAPPVLLVCIGLLCASACARDDALANAGSNAQPQGQPPVAVELVPVNTASLVDTIEVVGSLVPKFEVHVKSEYSGIVTDVYVTAWVQVRAGAPLARLDSREVATALEAARASLLQAEVAERRAIREFERAGNLKTWGLATQQQLDDVESAREAAAATTAAVRAQVKAVETRLDKTIIRAPTSGIVSFRGVNVGDRVENMGSSAPMFTIVDPRVLQATVTVPSAHLAAVALGQPLEFRVDGVPERTFAGTVMFINPTVDPTTRAATVQADISNAGGELKGGQFIRGRIVTASRTDVLQVPRSALIDWRVDERAADVFVVDHDRAVRRRIMTGRQTGDLVEVRSGLAAGQQVVARGAFNLKDGDRIRVQAPTGA